MSIVQRYLAHIEQRYINSDYADYWQNFIRHAKGADERRIQQLRNTFPLIPASLIELLRFCDGSKNDEYLDGYLFGYPLWDPYDKFEHFDSACYLNSSDEMLNNGMLNDLKLYINGDVVPPWGRDIDDKVTDKAEELNWLYFAAVSSQDKPADLFIDFSPSEKGSVGQVFVYFYYDEEIRVLADSFDAYLQGLMAANFPFIDYIFPNIDGEVEK